MNECELYKIPTEINVLLLIEAIHSNILHQGLQKANDKISEMKIYYKGIYNDLNEIKH